MSRLDPRADRARATTLRRTAAGVAGAALVAMAASVPAAFANHYQASLDGNGLQPASQFQIDTDANLVLDPSTTTSLDWVNVDQTYRDDVPTGRTDDSYAGGTKEDTSCPGATTGSIPNNKSDLRQFGSWVEEGRPGYLHLYWTRVSEPSGTTLMDFEFNQSPTDCASGPNKVRTGGDLLIEYSIVQGGARAAMTLRRWDADAAAWGAASDIAAAGDAAGTINTSPVTRTDSLTQDQSARTFGEASVDLNAIFDSQKCQSFGSAMLKSRSSDSFTSQLKDYIAPIPLTLTNCGKVAITKQTDPDGQTQLFDYTKTFGTDPATGDTFQLSDGQTRTYAGVLFGTGYTVTEDDLPAGWSFSDIDCSASTGDVGYTYDKARRQVTFDITDANDFLRCTYTNAALADLRIVKQVDDDPGTDDFAFTTTGGLSPSAFTLTPTGVGADAADSTTYQGIATGTYSVDETVPTGWNLVSATCDNGDDPAEGIVLGAGDDVTCTFVNARERGAIDIAKTRKHAADEGGEGPHPGVTFTVTDASDKVVGTAVTDAQGHACIDDLLYGSYTVTETVPVGYVATQAAQDVAVTQEADCGDAVAAAADVAFVNTPLTDVTITVDSQVDGGTASTIACVDAAGDPVDSGQTDELGDGSLQLEDLLPTAPTATLVCTITVDP